MSDRVDDRARRGAPLLPRTFGDRAGDMVVAGLIALTGAFFVWQAARLDLGGVGLPGPGFFPLLLGAILVVLAIAIGAGRWRSSEGDVVELGHRDVLIAVAALLAVPLLFEPLGAIVTLGLLATALLVLIARVRLPLAIAAAGLGMAACWYFFEVLLGVSLPVGPW
jgi:putative tricarboxylic transport membrane protein